jgi:hypothetical protein
MFQFIVSRTWVLSIFFISERYSCFIFACELSHEMSTITSKVYKYVTGYYPISKEYRGAREHQVEHSYYIVWVTDKVSLSPWERNNCSAVHKVSLLVQNPTIHDRVDNSLPRAGRIHCNPSNPVYLRFSLIFSCNVLLDTLDGRLASGFPTNV